MLFDFSVTGTIYLTHNLKEERLNLVHGFRRFSSWLPVPKQEHQRCSVHSDEKKSKGTDQRGRGGTKATLHDHLEVCFPYSLLSFQGNQVNHLA